MNVKSHGFDFSFDMNSSTQGLPQNGALIVYFAIPHFADSDKFLNNADSFLFNFVLISETRFNNF